MNFFNSHQRMVFSGSTVSNSPMQAPTDPGAAQDAAATSAEMAKQRALFQGIIAGTDQKNAMSSWLTLAKSVSEAVK